MVDLSPYENRIKTAIANTVTEYSDPRSAFLSELQAAGFKAKALKIGNIDRIDAPGDKRGKKTGWYIYQEHSNPDGKILAVGVYGSWRGTPDKVVWTSKSQNGLSFAERIEFNKAIEAARAEQDAERLKLHTEKAGLALEIWNNAKPADKDHPYLKAKGIKSCGARQSGNDLIIPITLNDEILSIQFIRPDGSKKFLTGGRKKGGYYIIEGNARKILCEGFSTGASIHEATGATIYIAFDAGNMFEVAGGMDTPFIVAGDDDDTGRAKAEQVADTYAQEVIYPAGYNDFNDMAQAQGLDAVKAMFIVEGVVAPKQEKTDITPIKAEGVLSQIAAYYNATAGNHQPEFAMQTALALASVILGRSYKTDYENYSSLYLLNVAKSGTGKEHAKTVIEKILLESGKDSLIAGDGYTSAGAVFSTLLDRPKHITVIDEFGRYLEAGRDMKGNHHQREANTKLMESIGRAHSVIRPPSYSTMTLSKKDADTVKNRLVYNPAITMMAMTTPDTFFNALDIGAIKDGFINRFVICISDAERALRKHRPPVDVPQSIIEWVQAVSDRAGDLNIAAEPSGAIELHFTQDAYDAQLEFQQECIDIANALEKFGMAELSGRANEMAMRIALIAALSENPLAETVELCHFQFGRDWIKSCMNKTVNKLKMSISSSDFEGYKKEILADLRTRGDGGITWTDMQKNAPYSRHKPKDLKEIMAALRDADLAADEPHNDGGRGRPTIKWRAI